MRAVSIDGRIRTGSFCIEGRLVLGKCLMPEAHTQKKGGWDTLCHFEWLRIWLDKAMGDRVNGPFPIKQTMTSFPHQIKTNHLSSAHQVRGGGYRRQLDTVCGQSQTSFIKPVSAAISLN